MTPYDLAQRFVGEVKERADGDHPCIVWAHELAGLSDQSDEVPWCSSWLNLVCWLGRWPRSKSARARSWLEIGSAVDLGQAQPGWDVVVLNRPPNPASGHVGLFAGLTLAPDGARLVRVLGGNQGNAVTFAMFPASRVIGVRRLQAGGPGEA